MNVLVTGSKGQLGSEIKRLSLNFPNQNFFFASREDLDICNKTDVFNYVNRNNISTIINCAAYTAVDKAESEPNLADKINHLAVRSLSEISVECSIRLIHISTDYVFNGKGFKPYSIDFPTEPINVYGRTKLAGENAMLEINPKNSMIIRTSWVYSSFGNNFVKTMLRLSEQKESLNVICDQVGSPTYAKDLAEFILKEAIHFENVQVKKYHFSNEGVCSWYDFAKAIMELQNRECEILPIPSTEYPTPAKRPYYSIMDKTGLSKQFAFQIYHWRDSLKKCLETIRIDFNSPVECR